MSCSGTNDHVSAKQSVSTLVPPPMWGQSLGPLTSSQRLFLLACAISPQPSHVTAHVHHLQKLSLAAEQICLFVIVHGQIQAHPESESVPWRGRGPGNWKLSPSEGLFPSPRAAQEPTAQSLRVPVPSGCCLWFLAIGRWPVAFLRGEGLKGPGTSEQV